MLSSRSGVFVASHETYYVGRHETGLDEKLMLSKGAGGSDILNDMIITIYSTSLTRILHFQRLGDLPHTESGTRLASDALVCYRIGTTRAEDVQRSRVRWDRDRAGQPPAAERDPVLICIFWLGHPAGNTSGIKQTATIRPSTYAKIKPSAQNSMLSAGPPSSLSRFPLLSSFSRFATYPLKYSTCGFRLVFCQS